MKFEIFENLPKNGKRYTIVKFPTEKEVLAYAQQENKRKILEDEYDENLIFVTDEKGGVSAMHLIGRVPFLNEELLFLEFETIDIEDGSTY